MLSESRSRSLLEQLFRSHDDSGWVSVNFARALNLKQTHSPEQLQSMLMELDDQLEQNPLDGGVIVPKMIPIMWALMA